MSPLKITLLLNAYCRAVPNGHLTQGQAFAPAMLEAIEDFKRLDLFEHNVTAIYLRYGFGEVAGTPLPSILTPKGLDLVKRLQEVES